MSDPRDSSSDLDDNERDEAPARKKKKKKKRQTSSPWLKIVGYGASGVVGLGVVALIIWGIVKVSGGGPPAQPVTAWDKFSTEELGFAFEYPKHWGAKDSGIKPRRQVVMKGSSATITVSENMLGSVVGDISGAGAGGQPISDDQLPVARVHDLRRPKDSPSYKEEPAATVPTQFGKARRSAYTDGSRRGYRATVLMNQSALDIFCECRASDWEVLRPAFEHMIESLGIAGL